MFRSPSRSSLLSVDCEMEIGAEPPAEMGMGKTIGIDMSSDQVRAKREGIMPVLSILCTDTRQEPRLLSACLRRARFRCNI